MWKFRILSFLAIIFVGSLLIPNLVADILRRLPLQFPARATAAPASDEVQWAGHISAIAPFRADLKADYVNGLAGQALKSEFSTQNELAQSAAKSALKIAPHDSQVWLVLALLRARNDLNDPLIAEALKMSYFTGPSRSALIATRLDVGTLNNSLNDPDLRELARGDIRAILTHLTDQRRSLKEDYMRGSAIGRKFIEENSRMIDPDFANSLLDSK
jgi:hypothetical protein